MKFSPFRRVFVALWLLAGCAVPPDPSGLDFDTETARYVFNAGYRNIFDKYIEPVDMGALTVRGLGGLKEIDPAIEIERAGGSIQLLYDRVPVRDFVSPGAGDVSGWAELSTQVIAAGRLFSGPLNDETADRIYEAVFEAALSGLDKHSRYANVEKARDYRAMREGFGGVGVTLDLEGPVVKVTEVLPDTPAARAGLKEGDVITHIDGEETAGLDRSEVISRLRGKISTWLSITVTRKGKAAPLTVSVKRALIVMPTVSLERRGPYAHIRISGFNQRTVHSLVDVLTAAKREAKRKLKGIVLDLRNNPGGLLDQAVAVADVFLTSGRIISTDGRHPDSHQSFDASGRDLAANIPLVVLINGRSASAAEVVAAALQDRGRAVVVGTNSFGKGSVQNITRLPNDGELILTWSRLYAPSGYSLDGRGVLPTVCTADEESSTADIMARLRNGRLNSAVLLASWRTATDDQTVEELRQSCLGSERTPESDLELAAKLLEETPLFARALELSAPALASP
ncbi:MAG: S41 family peptidase [Proteobacteria bacterium]|nr:S41 family peptidase [Pseudomonadota bacterium]